MKSIFNLLAAMCIITSCQNKNSDLATNPDTVLTTTQEIVLSGALSKTLTQEYTLTASYNTTAEKVIDYEISENLYTDLGITEQEFEEKLLEIEGISSLMYVEDEGSNKSSYSHSECMEKCQDKYTDDKGNKIKGRGRCKFNCWVDTSVKIILAILDVFTLDVDIN